MLALLKKAYYNRKVVENPRKRKEGQEETNSTQEGHDTQLKLDMKATKPNLKKISALMKASFAHRRKWIEKQSGKGVVRKVLQEYPGFRRYEQVSTKFVA